MGKMNDSSVSVAKGILMPLQWTVMVAFALSNSEQFTVAHQARQSVTAKKFSHFLRSVLLETSEK